MSPDGSFLEIGFENNRVIKAYKLVEQFKAKVYDLLAEQVRQGWGQLSRTNERTRPEPDPKGDLDRDNPYIRSQLILGGKYGKQALSFSITWDNHDDPKGELHPYACVKLKYRGGGVDGDQAPVSATYNAEEMLKSDSNSEIFPLKDDFKNSGGNFAILLTEFDEKSVRKVFESLRDYLTNHHKKFVEDEN